MSDLASIATTFQIRTRHNYSSVLTVMLTVSKNSRHQATERATTPV